MSGEQDGIWGLSREMDWTPAASLARAPSPSAENIAWAGLPTHVLIVEDDAGIRELLLGILKKEGFQVTAVDEGQAALQIIQAVSIQVVLTDFKLPDMDGITLLESLIEHDGRIMGIVMTGYGTIDLAVKAMKAGAADILLKPFDSDQVILALKRVLEVQRLRYENSLLKQAVLKESGVRLRTFHLQDINQPAQDSIRKSGAHSSSDTWRLAYQRGLIEGERRAREHEATESARRQTLAASLVTQLSKIGSVLPQGLEDQVAALAFKIACKVVRDCAEEKRDLVLAQAREALARVRESRSVEIRVNPRDLPVLETAREALAEMFEGPVTIKLEAEASISPGGCLVETPTRLIDATIEAQLIQLGEALKRRGQHEP